MKKTVLHLVTAWLVAGSGAALAVDYTYDGATNSYDLGSGDTLTFDVASGSGSIAGGTIAGTSATVVKTGDGEMQWGAGYPTRQTISLDADSLIDVQAGKLRNEWGTGDSGEYDNNYATLNIADGAMFDVWDTSTTKMGALTGNGMLTKTFGWGTSTFIVGQGDGSGTFAGTITNTAATLALTKIGNGTQTLTGINSYNGATTINGGTLEVAGSGSISTTPRIYVNDGTFTVSGSVTATGANYWDGGVSMASASWDGVNGSGNGSNGGTATLNLDGGTLSTLYVYSEDRVDDMGTPDDTSDDVTYTKGTSVVNFNGGTLQAMGNRDVSWSALLQNITTANVKAGGAIFDSNGYNIFVGQNLLEDVGSTGGGLTKNGAGQLEIGGRNTFTGEVIVNEGTLFASAGNAPNNGAFSYASGITVNNGATLRSNGNSLFGYDGSQAKAITINGGTAIAKDGDVNVGLVTLNGGELANEGGLNGWGSWNFGRAADKKLHVTDDATVSAVEVGFHNGADIEVDAGKNLDFTGTITDSNDGQSAVIKNGDGTLTLAGNNTYSGATTVNAGMLLVNGSISNSSVSVASGATVGGNGTIGGNLSLASGALLAFGSSDTLAVLGSLGLDNSFGVDDLDVADWNSVTNGTYILIDTTGDFSNIQNFGSANAYDIGGGRSAYFQNGSLELVVVPEPATIGMVSVFGFGILFVRRRLMM